MRCDSQAPLLAYTLISPCLGREPKAKVMTNNVLKNNIIILIKSSIANFLNKNPNILLFTLFFVYILPCFHPLLLGDE
jgi:hypothetical protein